MSTVQGPAGLKLLAQNRCKETSTGGDSVWHAWLGREPHWSDNLIFSLLLLFWQLGRHSQQTWMEAWLTHLNQEQQLLLPFTSSESDGIRRQHRCFSFFMTADYRFVAHIKLSGYKYNNWLRCKNFKKSLILLNMTNLLHQTRAYNTAPVWVEDDQTRQASL